MHCYLPLDIYLCLKYRILTSDIQGQLLKHNLILFILSLNASIKFLNPVSVTY